ncbi:MAG: hypothetical protein P8173_03155 [Gammaproteobacteria bacterium]|jgi:hypothetical protein
MAYKRHIIAAALLLAANLAAATAWAAGADRNWGVAPYLGLYKPSLKLLNEGAFRSPYQGTAQLIDQFGNNNNVTVPFIFRDPIPELDPGVLAGLEFQWRINDKHALLLGAGTWQATSSTRARGVFPVQGAFESVLADRKGALSYTEFYLGWRYNLIHKPKKYDFYLNFSVHDIFNVNYREDFSVLFLSGPPRSFRKSLIIESRATGLLLLQGAGGGEWFVNDWFSLGVEAGYAFGLKALRLGDGNLTTDFRPTDNLFLEVPLRPTASGTMQYKSEDGSGYRNLRLDFEGWKALVKATIYY